MASADPRPPPLPVAPGAALINGRGRWVGGRCPELRTSTAITDLVASELAISAFVFSDCLDVIAASNPPGAAGDAVDQAEHLRSLPPGGLGHPGRRTDQARGAVTLSHRLFVHSHTVTYRLRRIEEIASTASTTTATG